MVNIEAVKKMGPIFVPLRVLSHGDSQIAICETPILNYATRICEHSHGDLCSVIQF